MTVWLAVPSLATIALFAIGWCAGWWGYLRTQTLQRIHSSTHGQATRSSNSDTRVNVSVIIPCRNEAEHLQELLPQLFALIHTGDQVIVVDDESTDSTAQIAQQRGAVVVTSNALPMGWAGKPHACWQGAQHAQHDILVFLDADVRLGSSALDDLLNVLAAHPDALVSVMPWHRTGTQRERFSMLFNVISSMVASVQRPRQRRRVAYGPFMAVRRDAYFYSGGHAHPSVRSAVVEDLALARVMQRAIPFIGQELQVEYRMYPLGFRQLLEGWTKNTALGAVAVPRVSSALSILWVFSLCGGAVASMWCYALSVIQVYVISRRLGNFGAFSAVLYPLHAVVFVAVAVRSVLRTVLFGSVVWRGRTIATR
jgi:4,4'-diaponeurosporenoate glycosyltransferase